MRITISFRTVFAFVTCGLCPFLRDDDVPMEDDCFHRLLHSGPFLVPF